MILCCGEALIDMIPVETSGGDAFVPHSGGAIFNTAIALGRLGVSASMVTGLSDDLFGQQLRDGLEASHVDTSLVITSDRPTTLAFVKLVDGHASYVFYDENSAGRMIQSDEFRPIPDQTKALYFGGISLACEPGAEAYAALCTQVAKDHVVMIDPNIRPGFIRDEARYRQRLEVMMSQADIVKVSDEDLAWLMRDEDDLHAQARALQTVGPKIVIVTKGKDGAMALLPDGTEVSAASETVEVVDTVGAGEIGRAHV